MSVSLASIGQIHINVRDVERATAFYRDALGMKFLFQFPGMAFFDCGGVRLYLAKQEEGLTLATSVIYYRVPAIEETAAVLEKNGVRFKGRPHIVHRDARHELWMAFFDDSEGNMLALMSEVPVAAT